MANPSTSTTLPFRSLTANVFPVKASVTGTVSHVAVESVGVAGFDDGTMPGFGVTGTDVGEEQADIK